ncbi:MAG: hypothetical protein VX662_08605, partial [SAR324 cluster bacterium]|nr:hypothetical protein [SAR324 cluster bacterium]
MTCISTDNGSLNDPTIFGKYQNSHQDPACGKDFTFNYMVASGTEVLWDDNKTLSGTLVNRGIFNIQAPGVFEGELENEGILNLEASVVFEGLLTNKATLEIKSGFSGEVIFQGGLVNQGTFTANHNPDATVHWQGSTRLEQGSVELNGVSLKIFGDVQESGDQFSIQSTNLELSGRTVWMVPRSLTFSDLSLDGHTLLLGDNATGLRFSNKVTMDQASERII